MSTIFSLKVFFYSDISYKSYIIKWWMVHMLNLFPNTLGGVQKKKNFISEKKIPFRKKNSIPETKNSISEKKNGRPIIYHGRPIWHTRWHTNHTLRGAPGRRGRGVPVSQDGGTDRFPLKLYALGRPPTGRPLGRPGGDLDQCQEGCLGYLPAPFRFCFFYLRG